MILAGVWLHILVAASICRPFNHIIVTDVVEQGHTLRRNSDRTKSEDGNCSNITVISSGLSNNISVDQLTECPIHGSDNFTANPVQSHESPECQNRGGKSHQSTVQNEAVGTASSPIAARISCCRANIRRELKDYYKFICKPSMLVLLITFAVAGFAEAGSYFLLPLLVHEQGMDENFASRVIMIASVSELISRPIFGLISNRIERKKVYLLPISFVITGAFGLLLLLLKTSLSFIICAIVLGDLVDFSRSLLFQC